MSHDSLRFYPAWLGGLTTAAVIGCSGGGTDPVPPPPPPPPVLTVTSINPTSGFRDGTMDVHVLGTGFESSSRVVIATTKVRTNSTSFVSATDLLASITIEPDTPIGPYGVQVVTGSRQSTGTTQFRVALNVELVDLGAGDNSRARGVNNTGQIVGSRGADLTTEQAFLWDNGTFTNLGVLPGMTFSFASDINNNGVVVGVSGTGTLNSPTLARGFKWTAAGGMQALSTLGGALASAGAINDAGDIVGWATVSGTSPGHAVVWRNDVITDLQATSYTDFEGRAFAINTLGEVVGYVYGQSGFRATLALPLTLISGSGLLFGINSAGCIAGWTTGPLAQGYRTCGVTTRNVGSCGGAGSRTWAINSAGDVVGDAPNGGGIQQVPFLWMETGGITCFPLPQGSNGASAYAVNDNGWVVGDVSRPVGGTRATLWKVK
jgi:probable HAF family extracellular repeat protein